MLRAWFVEQIGPGFRFDGPMRTFIADGGRTLGDAVDHWYATRHRGPQEIEPQFELNRFGRAWRAAHPGSTHTEMLAAWAQHRALPVPEGLIALTTNQGTLLLGDRHWAHQVWTTAEPAVSS